MYRRIESVEMRSASGLWLESSWTKYRNSEVPLPLTYVLPTSYLAIDLASSVRSITSPRFVIDSEILLS
jgi:hypothetical protein